MKIKLIAVGRQMPAWVVQGYNEYAKRLPSFLKLELMEIPLGKRTKNADIKRLMAQEAKLMLGAIKPGDKVIALDINGEQWSTEILAKNLQNWREATHDVCLLVGGPEGLSADCLAHAHEHWSLSKLTLPHPLVRIVLAEQLYRAITILSGHPYHR